MLTRVIIVGTRQLAAVVMDGIPRALALANGMHL